MAQLYGVYRCNICGNVVRVNLAGVGKLVCCGKPMELISPKAEEEGKEKHLPVVERTAEGVKVKVGSVPHPMEEKHYIVWVEAEVDGCCLQKFLQPGDEPAAEFLLKGDWKVKAVRGYCNIHGLWETKASWRSKAEAR